MKRPSHKFFLLAGIAAAVIIASPSVISIAFAEKSACSLYQYPWCGAGTNLPEMVKQFYGIALGLAGGAAFGVIVYGAVRRMIAAGNPSGINDANEWIKGALFGVVLLFGAYMIFNTINPNLRKLQGINLEPISVSKDKSTGGTDDTGGAAACPSDKPNRYEYLGDYLNAVTFLGRRCGCDKNNEELECGVIFCSSNDYGSVCKDVYHNSIGIINARGFIKK